MPIYNDRTLFNLYSARPLPLYDDGKSLKPILDMVYFGVSVKNNEYTILSDQEQLTCQNTKICRVSDVLRRIEDTPHCVIKSFSKNVLTCPMEVSKDITGFYELHGRKMVYSVPRTETLKLICSDKTNPYEDHIHSTVTVSGVGLADIAPDCQVILPNDRRLYSNPLPLQESLPGANFMEVFNFLPELDNYTLELRDQSVFNHTVFTQLHLREVDSSIDSFDELTSETFNLKNSLPEVLRVFIGIICVLFLFFMACMCSPKFRTWFKTFVLWKNPHKWYTQFRGIDLSTWTRRGTKYHRANREIIRSRNIIEKTNSIRKNNFAMDSREYNPTPMSGYSDPITRACVERTSLKKNNEPLPSSMWVPVDPYAEPPGSNLSRTATSTLQRSPAFRRKSVAFADHEVPNAPSLDVLPGNLYPRVTNCYTTDPKSCDRVEKLLSSPGSIRRMLSETDCKPVTGNEPVPVFRAPNVRSTSSPATVRRWANPDTRPHAHEEDSAVVATIATQSSLQNTPEPQRRLKRSGSRQRSRTPPPSRPRTPPGMRLGTPPRNQVNSLAEAMRTHNFSSLDLTVPHTTSSSKLINGD